MKKFTIASLLFLSAACSLAAIGCNDDEQGGNNPSGKTYTVTFEAGEGYSVVGNGVVYDEANDCWKATVAENATFKFSLDVGAFYTGTPTVAANNVALNLIEATGEYSLSVKGDTSVSIDGIVNDSSFMLGSGTFDDAYVVSRPIDLVYIAQQVNAGKGNYATAAYVLANDIDLKGEALTPIGTAENPFGGCFSCYTNSETNEMERFTISNFTINTTDKNYVGLFGCVNVDMTVDSSGLFYGINIDNFEINASTADLEDSNSNVYCGGLIGYGIGTRVYLCSATNGEVKVSGDSTEYSFVGGLIGIQQSWYASAYGQFYNAETAYATVDVDVNVVNGKTLYAGGIAGYLLTNSFTTPSYIHNSYSMGNVSGAFRSGGIVGGLGQYSSVTTSYSTGNVTANVPITAQAAGNLPEHCIAYAGGIAGYAENDTVVNECFAVGSTTAKAADGASAEKTHHAIAGGDAEATMSVSSRKYIALNCLGSVQMDTLADTLQEMGFHKYNWIFKENAYPVINYEASDDDLRITTTIKYVDTAGNKVLVDEQDSSSFSFTNTYIPIARAFVEGYIGWYLTADDNKMLSFGYFFDEACTQPVPSSYITTKNTTVYIGFADPAAILGDYTLAVKGAEKPLKITINADGMAICADGSNTTKAYYQYNGETLIIEGANLARYFTGEVDTSQSVNEDAYFDINRYVSYYFQANITDSGLALFDGKYFTAENPLMAYAPTEFDKIGAYYTQNGDEVDEYIFLSDGTGTKNGRDITYAYADGKLTITSYSDTTEIAVADLKAYDALKGTWQKSTFVNKTFEFDGVELWFLNGKEKEGTYTVEADGVTYALKDSENNDYATAKLDEYGFLQITYADKSAETYGAQNSLIGEWRNAYNNMSLRLNGINAQGVGTAVVNFPTMLITYTLTYTFSETQNYLCLYYSDTNTPFGYFTYIAEGNCLFITFTDPSPMGNGAYYNDYLYLVNDFNGVWISNNTTFDNISFNGMGMYNEDGDWVSTVEINGKTVTYTLTKGGLEGYFDYNGERYTISYDDVRNEITLNEAITLERKDALADIDFVSVAADNSVTSFAFDGKSTLTAGGTMTVTTADGEEETYTYKKTTSDNANILDYYTISGNANGSIELKKGNAFYEITIGEEKYEMYIRNQFMGEWALSGRFEENVFVIGATDLDGYIHATFLGEKVKIEYLDTDFYFFYCEPDGMPTTYYMYVLYDNTAEGDKKVFDSIALSEYSSLIYNDYILCSKVDEMKGTWTLNGDPNSIFTISFDGVQSLYSNGIATMSAFGYPTPYLYKIYKDDSGAVESVMLWSLEPINGQTLYFKLTPTTDKMAEDTYVLGDKAYLCEEIDSLYKMEAKGKDGYTYHFDGGNLNNDIWGNITATKEGEADRTLTYDIVSFNDDKTVTLTVKEEVNGETVTYTATLHYGDNENLTIEFEEQTESENA